MAQEYCLILTTHNEQTWDAGDGIITEGVFTLLPELQKYRMMYSEDLESKSDSEIELVVAGARAVISAGTPSWMRYLSRKIWKACVATRKPISFLGIGLGVNYFQTFWDGAEDFMRLRDSGMIDLIVCRDKFTYYWLHHQLGFDSGKIRILPCPALYLLDPVTPFNALQRNIALSIPNPEETARQTPTAFHDWDRKFKHIAMELEKNGSMVHFCYQRRGRDSFIDTFRQYFKRSITCFSNVQEFKTFAADKDVYIGVRNHGALPFAGAGKPALLLGTDLRQFLADEIPFISRMDISCINWDQAFVFDWFYSLDLEGVGRSLINFRDFTKRRWREVLRPVLEKL